MHPQLANKYRKLSEYTDQMIDRLATVDPEILQHKPDNLSWSPIQVLDHLVMAERLSNGYIRKKFNAIEDLPDVGVKAKAAMYAMKIAQSSPKKFKAPSSVSQPNANQSFQEVIDNWKKERKVLADFLEAYPDQYINRALYKHPFIGRLSLGQMVEVHLYHIQRHMRQIEHRVENFHK